MQNLSIGRRLFLLVSFLSFVLVVIGILGLKGITSTAEKMHQIHTKGLAAIQTLREIKEYGLIAAVNYIEGGLSEEPAAWNKAATYIEEARKKIIENWSYYQTSAGEIGEEEKRHIEKVQIDLQEADLALTQLVQILKKHDKEQLNQFITNVIPKSIRPAMDDLNSLMEYKLNDAETALSSILEDTQTIAVITAVSIIVGISLAVIFATYIITGITNSLNEVIDALNEIAKGDISLEIVPKTQDEIGHLQQAMAYLISEKRKMANALVSVANGDLNPNVPIRSEKDTLGYAMNEMVTKLRNMTSKLQTEMNVLTNSGQEIVTSITEVTTGATETAAAVAETTTTVEELNKTSKISVDRAKEVLVSTEEASKIVKNSEMSLAATLEDMQQIKQRMHTISESILKLSEYSLAIRAIVDTVNEIAERSNLLAVNAAIEAAKAGEQVGKGFRVVAEEIKNHSEQSKKATAQIRVSLDNIQNATNAAVLATEQGTKAVVKGVEQSSQMSKEVRILAAGMSKVAQSANMISISNEQQLVAIGQVRDAMSNIRTASNQHVESMKNIEKALLNITEVTSITKEQIDQFKMS